MTKEEIIDAIANMSVKDIVELVKAMEEKFGVSAAAAAAAPAAADNYHEIKSPLVGTFYASAKPDAPAIVEVGSKVTKGMTLCIVEAMKNFNEIESDVDGVVREVCVKNGDIIEYGKVLFKIETN